jgi:hypothetical protein
MRRGLIALTFVVALLAFGLSPTRSVAASGWHSEQPVAAGIGVPVPLGEVGDIEFWAPNRGALITAGNGGMPAGVYAYDGTGWYLYSTVCGGHHGRIVWTGPDEFWTISDQRAGEETTTGNPEAELKNRSLCLFRNGEVVASYAEPIGQAGSYMRMNAAACNGPDDCWFGGERLPGDPNIGAFHLHWDGSTLSPIPSLTLAEPGVADPGHAVFGMTSFGGQIFESVAVRSEDPAAGEVEPSFLHRVNFGAAIPFEPLPTPGLVTGGTPEELEGFRFGSNGIELWALSGAVETFGATATPTLLRLDGGAFEQVPLTGGLNAAGTRIAGFAMEPDSPESWASFYLRNETTAHLARIEPDGSVAEEVQLPQAGEELNKKGTAGPIACPAVGDCWMATSAGWLFHLGGPPPEGPNTDPAMHQLIGFRPCDEACQAQPGTGNPEDDSGAEPEAEHFPEVPEYPSLPHSAPKCPAIYTHLKQTVIHKSVLQLSYVLHARAHVQLIAKDRKKVVAKTARMTLEKGPHHTRLRLDPKNWPTHLAFEVHQAKQQKKTKKASCS